MIVKATITIMQLAKVTINLVPRSTVNIGINMSSSIELDGACDLYNVVQR